MLKTPYWRLGGAAISAVLAAGAFALPAAADPVADFYRGKQIAFTHTGGSAGTFAIYSRILAEHIGKYIPGNPKIIVQFKSGGGGIVGMNYLYNAAPRDGTYFTMPIAGVESQPFLFPGKVKFDLSKVQWIGNMTQLQSFVAVWHTAPVKSWEDFKKREVAFGATGKGSETFLTPTLMNKLLGTKIKVITGYKGIMKVTLAMERGEVSGRGGGWTATMRPQWHDAPKKVRLLAQVGDRKLKRAWDGGPDVSNAPLLKDLAKNDQDRQLLGLLSRVLARPLVAPPGVPAERIAAMRAAFDKAMSDPALLADIRKRKMSLIDPMNWKQVTSYVDKIAALPASVKNRYRAAISKK